MFGVLLCVLVVCCVVGCVAPEKVNISAEVEAALIRMGDKTFSGRDTVIGGGGDSITTWILALGIVSTIPLSALFYTKVIRTLRIRGEKKKKQCVHDVNPLDG